MKISYSHLISKIISKPSQKELSQRLFQLGHEHVIYEDILDIEYTPNRGDCLSINGLLRDLKLFYDVNLSDELYEKDISKLEIQFENNIKNYCKNISFLKVDIERLPDHYHGQFSDYFSKLNLKKINFFTDVSNFISYETGQPTHCYDASALGNILHLDYIQEDCKFETLLDKAIDLKIKDVAFFDKYNEIVNVAGIVGGKKTACKSSTKSVIIECAYFDPEIILGKSVKYAINSDAAYKFERNTDPRCHNYVLRRFLKVIEDHVNINKAELFTQSSADYKPRFIRLDSSKINKILGTKINDDEVKNFLKRLGFIIKDKYIEVPSYRNDIHSINDISEEVARAIGYDNIEKKNFNISLTNKTDESSEEKKLRKVLKDQGFFEVINNPFTTIKNNNSIKVDNPLDSNKSFLRTELKKSLIDNLIYNEKRQHECVKLFEISDVYLSDSSNPKRIIGIIASGRLGKNYKDFSKKIDNKFIKENLNKYLEDQTFNFVDIPRDKLGSKSKNHISYLEIVVDSSFKVKNQLETDDKHNIDVQYKPISEFPSSSRDLSFSIKDASKFSLLEDCILNFKDPLLKEVYIFDYFYNEKMAEIKIGFRFIFQSKNSTVTDNQINLIIDKIILKTTSIKSVYVPGL